MKTKGGFKVEKFKKLQQPILQGNLEPMIYEGFVKGITFLFPVESGEKDTFDQTVKWDRYGRCNNWARKDCFIKIPTRKQLEKLE
jgi:hypothetical protein